MRIFLIFVFQTSEQHATYVNSNSMDLKQISSRLAIYYKNHSSRTDLKIYKTDNGSIIF